ncbi:mj0570-related domain protein [Ichthyophthirius multifiliis]|uniref:Diphthine--ammonia ligase n=1 Tax=Ichthyophthirius multifiliis TaxID=5932 RepID=G0QZW9_ICHMU|nr:mj0570-related domain protein [Ichthyophthirius multifiliis]EGR29231.1 mj0570-related domain protein [Ichthyophthirius multifiliis]|eukprot:XP_004030467.1 mj0570-related domain protein [Ichthyophthirius multifiliis]
MKFIALISGGKDSIFNIYKAIQQGHELVAVANLYPAQIAMEQDSYMYQSVGTNMAEAIAECLQIPLIKRQLKGKPIVQDLYYTGTAEQKKDDEVEDLYELLLEAKQKWDFKGVSSGAIASTYQKLRIEDVQYQFLFFQQICYFNKQSCKRLDLESLVFLWGRNQQELLKEMIDSGMNSILIKVASYGLGKQHLGMSLRDNYDQIIELSQKCNLNICGEGGEYESLTLDCPLYKKRIAMQIIYLFYKTFFYQR